MKRTLKAAALIALVALACTLLAGCHGSRGLPEFEVPDEFDASRQYEITFWAKNDTNMDQVAVYEQAAEDFEKIYPNIKVNIKLYTDYGQIYNDVITNISTNTTPNVCITYPDHIATYMTGDNCVTPLDALMTDEKYGLGGSEVAFDAPAYDEMVPEFLAECEIDGQHYAVPFMRSTEACYVNKTYVEKLGYELPETLTWNFIWEVSEAAMAKDEDGNYLVNGQKVLIPFIYKSTDNMMIQMLRQIGADYSTDEGGILLFNEDTENILYTVAEHAESGAFSTFKISSYPANFMNAGQCIFAVDSTAGATWMGSDAPNVDIAEEKLVDFETAVMLVPQYDTENPQMISQGPSVCIFNKEDPQEVLASWLFVQYLLTNQVQIGYAQTEGYAPVTIKAQKSEEYRDYISRSGEDDELYYDIKIQATQLLMDNTENTFVTPVFNGSASLRNAAGQLIEEVVKASRRGKTVDGEFIKTLYGDTEALYKLDQLGEGEKERDLGPLPGTARALLAALGGVWVLMILYVVYGSIKKNKLARRA